MSIWQSPEKIGGLIDSILCEKGYLNVCKEWDVSCKVERNCRRENCICYRMLREWKMEDYMSKFHLRAGEMKSFT